MSTAALRRVFTRVAPTHIPFAYRLAVVFTLLIAGGMLLLGLQVTHDQGELFAAQMREFGRTVAAQFAEAAREPLLAGDLLTLEVVTSNLADERRVLGAAVYAEDGSLLRRAGAVPAGVLVPVPETPPIEWGAAAQERTRLISFVAPVTFQELVVGYTLVTLDRSLMQQARRETLRAVTGTTLVLLLLSFVASILLGKRLTRPLHRLMDASRAISAGDYRIRFEERRNDELGLLMQAMNTMTEGLLRKEQVERVFSRYVSPGVAREVLNDLEQVRLGGRHVEASVLFADIVGFTAISERLNPEEVSGLLNEYFSYISRAAELFGGYVDKYIGDCAMLVFGVPEAQADHRFRAVGCAVLIQQLVESLNIWRRERGLIPVRFRIGINSGEMLAGNMGATDRLEYTVVGDKVNLASRLASVAGPGEIVVSEEFCADPTVAERIESRKKGTIKLRGKRTPVATFVVTALSPGDRALLEERFAALMNHPQAPPEAPAPEATP